MNVIFLDVDGVLNDFVTLMFTTRDLNDEKLEMIGCLCEEQNCKIVLSTSWRHDMDEITLECKPNTPADRIKKALNEKGCQIIGRTGGSKSDRGLLIEEYVQAHLSVGDRFLIIDDEDVIHCAFTDTEHPSLAEHFLQTDAIVGMTFEDFKKAEAFFLGNSDWRSCKAADFIAF